MNVSHLIFDQIVVLLALLSFTPYRAALMKKSNGAYFPEELISFLFLFTFNYVKQQVTKCPDVAITESFCLVVVVGIPNYTCPELLAGIPYGFKSDFWSLELKWFLADQDAASYVPGSRNLSLAIEATKFFIDIEHACSANV
ncbi:hypothetical protein FEM48_Zijuj07G0160200 [Ziziphus jujuba var. spinosa]|uniref:Uncharacterized protein n=1 Tax=Ziziphus jujuba var. spinosa TaxID=714518 RepID=A0A978V5J1_ZIZJJ|nr:hypothetical protein FEM48_Zijuj07G0158600 [Ziziphus jujuba var. spinosa]KAH7522640.1 hypothetical protein FEM48_Zijuj07G0160200 [Ziziphus jujuba var. spinosa]